MKNSYRAEDDKVYIELMYKDTRMEAIIDKEDLERVQQYGKWWTQKKCNTFYAYTLDKNRTKVFMHRLINETPKELVTDHKDRNGLNNTRINLISVTNAKNQLNRAHSTGHNYVYWQKDKQRYRVKVKGVHVGYSKDLDLALKMRDKYIKSL